MDYSNDKNSTELAGPTTSSTNNNNNNNTARQQRFSNGSLRREQSTNRAFSDSLNALQAHDKRQANEIGGRGAAEPSPFGCFLQALFRKKPLDCRTDTHLNRCLNLLDLTALG